MIRYTRCLMLYIFCSMLLLSSCSHDEKIILPGYFEGKYSYITTNFGGELKKLYVSKGETVKAGTPLFLLESYTENEDLQAANARVLEAENNMKKASSNYNLQKTEIARKQGLYKKDIVTKAEYDNSMTAFQQAIADKKAAEQNLIAMQANQRKANWTKQQKNVNAPLDSILVDTFYNQGELVNPGTPVLSLLVPSQIKIIFYVPEVILSKLKINDVVKVTCDSCPKPIEAKITYISERSEFTPPVIYSTEERVKLVYRFEAQPMLKNAFEIHPGQPASVVLEFAK